MNAQKLRLICAELDGWTLDANVGNHPEEGYVVEQFYRNPAKSVFAYSIDELPNYPEDLNAVHELEKKLIKDMNLTSLGYYRDFLFKAVGLNPYVWAHSSQLSCVEFLRVATATALQRCEALARLHGKWEEK